MDAVAYPHSEVSSFVTNHLVPLRIASDNQIFATRFRVKWTPSLIILDDNGNEHSRTVGFFSPDELIPSLLLGMGKAYFNSGEFNQVHHCLEQIVSNYPASFQAPEAVYLNGVCRFIESHGVAHLIALYDSLVENYPASEWLMRADPYRLLKS